MRTMVFLMVVLLGAALMGCDMMQPGADYQPDAVEVSEDAATEVSEPDPPAEPEAARKLLVAAHGDEHHRRQRRAPCARCTASSATRWSCR